MEYSNKIQNENLSWIVEDLMRDPETVEENIHIVDTSQENIDRLTIELSKAEKTVEAARKKAHELWLIPINSIGSEKWNENMDKAHNAVIEAKGKYERISQELSYIKN